MLYRLRKVSDLRPHPKNPREMTPAARQLLIKYLAEFGDLSGVVLNARSGYLISGHQRVAELTRAHGAKLKLADSAPAPSL